MDIITLLEEITESNPENAYSIAFFDIDRYLTYPEETRITLVDKIKDFIQKQIHDHANVRFFWVERDEFILVLPYFLKSQAKDFVDRLLSGIENEFKSISLTSSVGVVQYPVDGLEVTELLRKAEEALNRAKRLGRNRAVLSEERMIMRSNYYTSSQLNRLRVLSNKLSRKESEIFRELLEDFLNKNGMQE